jgi:CDP-glucose 4,6-dehydratase
MWGEGATWVLDERGHHPHEAQYLKLDCSKAKARLHWHPRWSLEHTLRQIIEWHKSGQNDSKDITMRQIESYLDI